MDKNAIKKYAVWARNELIARVSQKAQQYGITAKGYGDKNADSVNGVLLSATEKKQRQALIAKIDAEGFEQVMEEVAYTWFNRFTALRFMEVNNYLPSHTRVFTNEANEFKPQILADAISLEIEGLDMDKVFELKDANKDEELYKYLLIVQCNALSSVLPGMFQKIEDYTELLLPDYLLREGSLIDQMIDAIPENDWSDQVQIIGWLYQYYNSEKKDDVFAALKNNIKISKENIPAVTQLFTPDWIVRYMVENSLGRFWVEAHPNEELVSKWQFYLDEADQEKETKSIIDEISSSLVNISPEELKCIDPCSGSGHILCYMFDVLFQIYENYGYTAKEAVESIIKNNLYGMDIDERAAQLAYFSVMMKARKYGGRRVFSSNLRPNVYSIKESNHIAGYSLDYFCGNDEKLMKDMKSIISQMHDAKEYGSILTISPVNFTAIYNRAAEIENEISIYKESIINDLIPVVKCAEILSQKYHAVVTNPPYMEISGGSKKLIDYVNQHFIGGKTDMFAVFAEHAAHLADKNGFVAMITQPSITSLVSFEKLRRKLFDERTFYSMLHMGRGIFGIDFGSVSFVYRNQHIKNYTAKYFRLYERTFQFIQIEDIRDIFLNAKKNKNYNFDFDSYDTSTGVSETSSECGNRIAYEAKQDKFMLVPGIPFAYTMSENMISAYSKGLLGDIFVTREGMATAGNDDFLRMWYEVKKEDIAFGCSNSDIAMLSKKRWFPYNKGGDYRKWYGNNDYVVDWENDGYRIRNNKDEKTGRIRSHNYNGEYSFKRGLTWSSISAGDISIRWSDEGFLFDSKGAKGFGQSEEQMYAILGFLNSSTAMSYLKVISPTMDFKVGDIIQLPLEKRIFDEENLVALVRRNIELSKEEWSLNETSWEFGKNPIVKEGGESIKSAVESFVEARKVAQRELKENEEQINKIIAEVYGLSDDSRYEVPVEKLSISIPDENTVIKAFISYAVGCMFGRYSLESEGVIDSACIADISEKSIYKVDKDNIIPICDDEYFEDDIVGRFIEFVKVVFGTKSIEDNLSYIADCIGGKGNSREVIRNYFTNNFFTEHCNMYSITGSGKRPVYWLFDSGKKNGFKCMIYMHRYQADTIARIRTDYVHEQQSRYRTAITDLEQRINSASTSEKVKLSKKLKTIKEQAEELRLYEEKIHHLADQMISINLNDGVKKNYTVFQDVLAKIK